MEERVGKQRDKGTKGAGGVQAGAAQCTYLAVPCVRPAQSVLASH